MAQVDLDSVRKVYDNGHVAVAGATFTVEDGEFVVLVGPSGCGKSTTLRMIAGLEDITSGTLTIGDRIVNDVSPKDRDIAMVFQNYALYPHMTVFDNMAFGLKLRKFDKAEIKARVGEAAELLGITAELDRKPKALSGGQRQRVALGRAIVRKPQVFLFDEPLSNLDAKLRVQTRTEISRLHKRLGATMIYVTHDQVEAMTMGDRIVVLKDGHIQQIAPPLTLYQQPANSFVGEFIGSPAMNFIEGTLTSGPAGGWFVDGPGIQVPLKATPLDGDGPQAGDRIRVGVRPEAIRVAGPEEDGFAYRLDVVEPMGNEVFVYARPESAEGDQIVARVAPQRLPEPGSPIRLAFDPGALHLFDGQTGEVLST